MLFVFLWSSVVALSSIQMVAMKENSSSSKVIVFDGEAFGELESDFNLNLYPDLSADGESIAYMAGNTVDSLGIYLNTGDKILEIYKKEGWTPYHPNLSRKKLCFSACKDGRCKIVIYDLESQRSEDIEFPSIVYFPILTNDGQTLYFQTEKGGHRIIAQYDLVKKNMSQISSPDYLDVRSPELSYDEKKLVFTRKLKEEWSIVTVELDSGKIFEFPENNKDEFAPTFHPDGSIYIASNNSTDMSSGLFKVFKFQVDGQYILEKESEFASLYAPSFSGFGISSESQIPLQGRSSFGSVYDDGTLYVAGGHLGQGHVYKIENFTKDFYSYKNKAWKKLADLPEAIQGFEIISYKGSLYTFGGFAYNEATVPHWKSLDKVFKYSIENNSWSEVARLPRGRSSYGLAQKEQIVYLFGGWDSTPSELNDAEGFFHRDIIKFNLDLMAVEKTDLKLPDPLRRAFSVVTHEGKAYLLGGISEGAKHFGLLDNVTEFDLSLEVFSERDPLPQANFAPTAAFMNDHMMIFGGYNTDGSYISDILDFQKDNNHFVLLKGQRLGEPKGFAQAIEIDDHQILIIGGHKNDNLPSDTVEIFYDYR